MKTWSGNDQLNNVRCSKNQSDSHTPLGRRDGQKEAWHSLPPSVTAVDLLVPYPDLLTGPAHLSSRS